MIAAIKGKLVEIQVRTMLQHRWAELSEKYSDVVDPAIKYGGGDPQIRDKLDVISDFIGIIENWEDSEEASMQENLRLAKHDLVSGIERLMEHLAAEGQE